MLYYLRSVISIIFSIEIGNDSYLAKRETREEMVRDGEAESSFRLKERDGHQTD